jgi:hypothetical protein
MALSKTRPSGCRFLIVALVSGLLIAACGPDDAGDPSSDEGPAGQQGIPTATVPPSSDEPEDGGEEVATEPSATPEPASGSSEPTEAEEPDPEGGQPADPAPALGSIDSWHNSEPLTLDQLRGSPVLLVFWADF